MASSSLLSLQRCFQRTPRLLRDSVKFSSLLFLTKRKSTVSRPLPVKEAKEANWKCRQDLATALRGLDWYGLSEGVTTHLTLMAPAANGDGEVMLMISLGLHWSQATPSSLIGLNSQGEIVEGEGTAQCEATAIHQAVHDARPDAACVFHLHSPYTTAMGFFEEQLFRMYSQTHCHFYNDFAYDTAYGGIAKSSDEGKRLAKILGNKAVLFMANHGVLFAAPNVPIAFDNAYFMERACMMQILAMQTGRKLRELPDEVSKLTYEQNQSGLDEYSHCHLEGVRAVLEEKDPGFLNR